MVDDRASLDLLRRRLINVVGHELRTPITTLRGLTELLGTTGDDQVRTEELHDAMRRAARRAEALVDDLLVAAGIATALPVDDAVPTDVEAAVAEAWGELEGVPNGLDLAIDVPPGLAVLARPASLRRALIAVLHNAVKYGGDPIDLTATSDGDDVVLTVRDGGPGVPEAERALVTEAFFRGERAVMTAPGLGLGLSLAAELAGHDGGSVAIGDAVVLRWPRA